MLVVKEEDLIQGEFGTLLKDTKEKEIANSIINIPTNLSSMA